MNTKAKTHNWFIAMVLLIALLLSTFAGTGIFSVFQLSGKAASIKSADVTVKQAGDGNWYTFTKNGNKRVNYTGVAQNGLGWWRTENGKVNFKATGVYQNEYGWWRVENGKVNFKAKGVFQNSYGWWYCKDGKVQFGYNGIQNNKNGWWRIANGKVDFDADGVFQNELGWWYCRNGKVDFSYTGLAKNQHGTWSIKGGKVDFDDTKKLGYNETSSYAVKTLETDWGVEKHGYSYNYDLQKKTLTVTDTLRYSVSDWGDGGLMYYLTKVPDGLVTKGIIKQYPEIAALFCNGCFFDEFVLAYNPLIRNGSITKMVVNGTGSVVSVPYGDKRENNYQTVYSFTSKNGLLQKVDIEQVGRTAKETMEFSYDRSGLLIYIEHKSPDFYYMFGIDRDETGFPIRVGYGHYRLYFDNVLLKYDSKQNLIGSVAEDSNQVSEMSKRTFTYDADNRIHSVAVEKDGTDLSCKLVYSNEGLLTKVETTYSEPSPLSVTEGCSEFTWQKL